MDVPVPMIEGHDATSTDHSVDCGLTLPGPHQGKLHLEANGTRHTVEVLNASAC